MLLLVIQMICIHLLGNVSYVSFYTVSIYKQYAFIQITCTVIYVDFSNWNMDKKNVDIQIGELQIQ